MSLEKYKELRKSVISQEFKHLNLMQQEAVLKTQGALLLLAGAGSGKTTVIINRIVNLLKYGCGSDTDYIPEWATQEHIAILEEYLKTQDPSLQEAVWRMCAVTPPRAYEILAITFTNKAAGELKNRLEVAVGAMAHDIWAHTFHACCIRILRRDGEKVGFTKNFTIYDEDDKKKLLKSIVADLGLDEKRYDPKYITREISQAKDRFENPSEYEQNAQGDIAQKNVARVYKEYAARLMACNAMDFDDIIIKTVELLYEHQQVREYYQNKFKYVLVDEYQDTNHAQYLLCSLLAGGYQNICVVGDDDQSIYKFRGATIKNIMEFEKQYKNAVTIRLEQNYRSTTNILSAANQVISQNTQRKGKTLWTDNGDGEKIKVYLAYDHDEEAGYIASQVLKCYAKDQVKLKDMVVLYRSHVLSNNIENAFARNGIQYRIFGGLRFFDRAEVKDVLAYLWLISNPADTVRFKRIINQPSRKIGDRALELLDEISKAEGLNLFEVCEKAKTFTDLSKWADRLVEFADMINSFRETADTISLSQLYDDILNKSGYMAMLEAGVEKEGKGRIENVLELKSNIAKYVERVEEGTLGGFLEEIALFTDLDRYDTEADAVTLMTMHSAKGLEFDTVFICGAEDGLFPSFRSLENDMELEEERRLCYVAMTRAKRQLYITSAQKRLMYGQTTFSKQSRFTGEIPSELTEDTSKRAMAKQLAAKHKETSFRMPKATMLVPNDKNFVFTLKAGDDIVHSAFGKGRIVKATPVGGDVLLEVMFESEGKKMMMEKTAMKFMTK